MEALMPLGVRVVYRVISEGAMLAGAGGRCYGAVSQSRRAKLGGPD